MKQVLELTPKLYAVAAERYVGGRWVPHEIVYVHALDGAQARFTYLQGSRASNVRIVGIALAIGHIDPASIVNA
jgi:hypothetical protein